ncbi:MAG TPA: hypothetical protein VJB13_00805 [Candidatus Nanoarchaeia archaeon]|nr:hypothetical protein [Candidatus Nanoarchaeia archaeon]
MYNQYLLTELIRAQVKVEQAEKIHAEAKFGLSQHDLNIDDFVISGDLSLPEVLHPTTTYHRIGKDFLEDGDIFYYPAILNRATGKVEMYIAFIDVFQLSVQGLHNNNSFKSIVSHKDIAFPFPYNRTRAALQTLEKLETYLLGCQAAQQPEYNSTYRMNTKLRTPELK